MSQMYRLEIKESVRATRRLRDRVVCDLALTPLLDPQEMLDLLRQELVADGFVDEGGRCSRVEADAGEGAGEVRVAVDLEARSVEITLERDVTITTEVTLQERGDADREPNRDRARERLRAASQDLIEREVNEALRAPQEALTAELEGRLDAHRRALNGPLQRVYAEALKRKARQMGDVVEQRESTQGGVYELLIKITQ